MNIGYLPGRTFPAIGDVSARMIEGSERPWSRRPAAEDLDQLQLIPDVNPAIADLSGR
jgi:hypothetical protein